MAEEHSVDENEESSDSFNRRSFVKALGGAGGAAVTGGMFTSQAQATTPLQSSSKNRKPITGDELNQLTRKASAQKDVKNVMDTTMRETVQSGTTMKLSHSGSTNRGVTQGPPHTAEGNGPTDLGENEVIVSAVRHTLENGNEMTALAYVTDSEAILSRRFKEFEDGVKQKASRWKIGGETVEDASLELLQASANGELMTSSGFATMACSGCNGLPGGGKTRTGQCTNYNVVCLASCSACGVAKGCTPCLIACVTTWCAWLLSRCCRNWKYVCRTCGNAG